MANILTYDKVTFTRIHHCGYEAPSYGIVGYRGLLWPASKMSVGNVGTAPLT